MALRWKGIKFEKSEPSGSLDSFVSTIFSFHKEVKEVNESQHKSIFVMVWLLGSLFRYLEFT